MVRIGLLYVRGSLPLYESFGYLPTDLVREPRDLERPDMLIIPPGNIVETNSVDSGLAKAVQRFADNGGLVLGICSGLQLLAREVDTGLRRVEGLKLIDVTMRRLIALDWAEIEITESTWLTRGLVGKRLRGLHIHTYGLAEGSAKPFLMSYLPRHNYFAGPIAIPSGFIGKGDNVLGMLPHFLLDLYPELRENVLRELGVSNESSIVERNRELRKALRRELGVNSGVTVDTRQFPRCKKVLAVVSGETGEGKTFVVTGLAGALRKLGYNVTVAKLGSDLRDLHPALYLIKQSISPCMGIALRGRRAVYGWISWQRAFTLLLKNADILIVESVMGLLTGYSKRCGCRSPCSTLEFLECSRIPALLVLSCSRGGFEDAVERALLYISILRQRNLDVVAVVFNNFYGDEIDRQYVVKRLVNHCGNIYTIPSVDLGPASIPETDLDLHQYSFSALAAISKSIPIDKLIEEIPCYTYAENHRKDLELDTASKMY